MGYQINSALYLEKTPILGPVTIPIRLSRLMTAAKDLMEIRLGHTFPGFYLSEDSKTAQEWKSILVC